MILVVVILWVVFAALLAWQLLRWLPAKVDKHNPLPYAIALLPLATFVIGMLFLCCCCAAVWCEFFYGKYAQAQAQSQSQSGNITQSYAYLCVSYAVLFLISLQSYMPYWIGKLCSFIGELRSQSTASSPIKIRVMTLNCRYGRANASQIIKIAEKYHINTLLLQELSESLVNNLKKLGICEIFPTSCIGAQSEHNNGGFNAIFTQYSAIETCDDSVEIEAAKVPTVTTARTVGNVGTAGTDFTTCAKNIRITFASAHTKSPMRSCKAWSEGICALAKIAESSGIEEGRAYSTLTIITGDLNSTIDHPSFRSLLKAGFTDAGISLGKRLRTWPTWLKWPNLTLDHVIFCAKNCRAAAGWQQNAVVDGTDHLAYMAEIKVD